MVRWPLENATDDDRRAGRPGIADHAGGGVDELLVLVDVVAVLDVARAPQPVRRDAGEAAAGEVGGDLVVGGAGAAAQVQKRRHLGVAQAGRVAGRDALGGVGPVGPVGVRVEVLGHVQHVAPRLEHVALGVAVLGDAVVGARARRRRGRGAVRVEQLARHPQRSGERRALREAGRVEGGTRGRDAVVEHRAAPAHALAQVVHGRGPRLRVLLAAVVGGLQVVGVVAMPEVGVAGVVHEEVVRGADRAPGAALAGDVVQGPRLEAVRCRACFGALQAQARDALVFERWLSRPLTVPKANADGLRVRAAAAVAAAARSSLRGDIAPVVRPLARGVETATFRYGRARRRSPASRRRTAAKTSSREAPASIIWRWRWAPLRSGKASSTPSSPRTARSRREPLDRLARGVLSAASRSISLPSRPKRIARHMFSSISRGAGSSNGTPSSTSRAAWAMQATISAASASDSCAVACTSQMRTSTVPKLKCGRTDHQTCVNSTIELRALRNSMYSR